LRAINFIERDREQLLLKDIASGIKLHSSITMPLVDHLFAVGWIRKRIWQSWYPFLTERLRGEGVFFLNYAFEEDPPMRIALSPAEEPNRACAQLYHHVASHIPLGGKDVLEVSCGHGGGAAYVTRTFLPRSYTAVDLNPGAIQFCRENHRRDGLLFRRSDAQNLPFEPNSFDAVINVEASHCYPDFPQFLAEVARVLRPGGHFLYADFRFADSRAEWEQALAACPLKIDRTRTINAEVLRGMDRNSARSLELIGRHLPKCLRGLGRDFAGVRGSRIYNALASGELTYRSYCLTKPSHKN
jgi:SAM-dependent methyltransferase